MFCFGITFCSLYLGNESVCYSGFLIHIIVIHFTIFLVLFNGFIIPDFGGL